MAELQKKHKKSRLFVTVGIVTLIVFGIWKWQTPSEQVVADPDPATERVLNSGKVVGFSEKNGSHTWLGIPYAKPPVGPLRWKAPEPAVKRETSLMALKAGSFCPQIGNPSIDIDSGSMGEPVGSEDCLYLNVWAPPHSRAEIKKSSVRLPVMFWIHGGGNSIGHGANYSGRRLAVNHNLVVVTINYRLGPLGWFSHPALKTGTATAEDRSGNFGTLDIIQALNWVRGNIASFGGDPNNITVFGESAGAFNTVSMLLAPKAKGLFHRAIIQSGGVRLASMSWAENFNDATKPGHGFSAKEVVNLLLISDGKAATRKEAVNQQKNMPPAVLETYLRSKSPSKLLSVYKEFGFGMINFPNIFKDGLVLPKGNDKDLLREGSSYNQVPVIIGTNRDEFKLFMAFDPKYVDSYLKIIYRVKDKEQYAAVAGYFSDAWKASGVDRIADQLSQSQGEHVFAYRFDWDEEPAILGSDLSFLLGAAHMLEVPFVFMDPTIVAGLDRIFNDDNKPGWVSLSNSMASYWAEFAYSGSPGRGRHNQLPEWKPWPEENGSYIILDTPGDQGIHMANDKETMPQLKSRFLSDSAFIDQKIHCELYVTLFGDASHFISDTTLWNDREFENLGKKGCRAYTRNDFIR